MDLSSMRPSSWNGVGAIAKVPAAWAVSFVICASILYPLSSFRGAKRTRNLEIPRCAIAHLRSGPSDRPGMTVNSKPPCAHLDLFLGEEDLLGVVDDVLGLPAGVRRLPAVHFHHPHLADAARAGDAEHLAGLVAGQIADHV